MDLEARSSSVRIGIICETAAQLARWRELPVDCVIPHQSLVNRLLVQDIQRAGRRIFVWTVNDEEDMRAPGSTGEWTGSSPMTPNCWCAP